MNRYDWEFLSPVQKRPGPGYRKQNLVSTCGIRDLLGGRLRFSCQREGIDA